MTDKIKAWNDALAKLDKISAGVMEPERGCDSAAAPASAGSQGSSDLSPAMTNTGRYSPAHSSDRLARIDPDPASRFDGHIDTRGPEIVALRAFSQAGIVEPFVCHCCGWSFATWEGRENHIERDHTPEPRWGRALLVSVALGVPLWLLVGMAALALWRAATG